MPRPDSKRRPATPPSRPRRNDPGTRAPATGRTQPSTSRSGADRGRASGPSSGGDRARTSGPPPGGDRNRVRGPASRSDRAGRRERFVSETQRRNAPQRARPLPIAALSRQPWPALSRLLPETAPRDSIERLQQFAELLLDWNRGVSNLISR